MSQQVPEADPTAGSSTGKPSRRPPNVWPYNMVSVEKGEAYADEAARQLQLKKEQADAEKRRAKETVHQAEAERQAFTSQYGAPSVKQPMMGEATSTVAEGGANVNPTSTATAGSIGSIISHSHQSSGNVAQSTQSMSRDMWTGRPLPPPHAISSASGPGRYNPINPYVIPAHEVQERDRIIANERRLVKEREEREQAERRAKDGMSLYGRPRPPPSPGSQNLATPQTASKSSASPNIPTANADALKSATPTARSNNTPRSPDRPNSIRPSGQSSQATVNPPQPRAGHVSYPVYGGYMTYQVPKPAAAVTETKPPGPTYTAQQLVNQRAADDRARVKAAEDARRQEEQKRASQGRPERPYVYKPEPLPGPPPPSATGREYTYNPRDKRPRMDAAVDSAGASRGAGNTAKRPKHASRATNSANSVLPDSYRKIPNPPEGILMENAPRDWSGFSETVAKGYKVSSNLVQVYLDSLPQATLSDTVAATYEGKDWTLALAGLTRPGREGTLIELFIPVGITNTTMYLRDEPGWDPADPAWHDEAFDLSEDIHPHMDQVQGKLWGTDVYTDDSDVGALLIHAGFVRWENAVENRMSVRAPAKSGITVSIRVLPPMVQYYGTAKRGVRSRPWGNSHDGLSIKVESVRRYVKPETKSSRQGLKQRMRENALQRRVIMGDIYRQESAAAHDMPRPPSSAVDIKVSIDKEGSWFAYNVESLHGWLDEMSDWSIWTRDLHLLAADGDIYEFYHLGGDINEPHMFTIGKFSDRQADSLADQIGLEDVYFCPTGIAFRDEQRFHGTLLPLVGYRWIKRSSESSFKLEAVVGQERTQSLREARELAGRCVPWATGKAGRDMQSWAIQEVQAAKEEWLADRSDVLVKRGWVGPLDREAGDAGARDVEFAWLNAPARG